MYIDSHTHLNSPQLFADWQKHILEFEKEGGIAMINAGSDAEYNNNGLEIAKKYKGKSFVKATIGFHPYDIEVGKIKEEDINKDMEELRKLYLNNKEYIVAIGEAGIDVSFNKDKTNLDLQKKLFRAHCKLAREVGLPIVIHSRDDIDSTLDVLKDFDDLKIYFHCWGYGPEDIKRVQDMFENVWIGFCANITYPKAQNLRDSLAVVNEDNILLETDAPYLPPQQFRGKTNYPVYVKHIYDFVCEKRNVGIPELQKLIKNNFYRLYLK